MTSSSSDDEDWWSGLIYGILVLLVIGWLARRCYKCFISCTGCCRREQKNKEKAKGAKTSTPNIVVKYLRPKKQVNTSYVLWATVGLFGAHHFYLGRVAYGILCVWTMNFFGIGQMVDIFLIPYYVRQHNKLTADHAPYDGSFLRHFQKMILIMIALCIFAVPFLFQGPIWFQYFGWIDFEQIAAQTAANPYDILGLPRSANLSEAKIAYRKASMEWHPDKNPGCGRKCDDKMAEIGKAFDQIKRGLAPTGLAKKTWEEAFNEAIERWIIIIEHYNVPEDATKQEEKSKDPWKKRAVYRKLILKLLWKHDMKKAKRIDKILNQYKGSEDILLQLICDEYHVAQCPKPNR